MAQNLKGRSLLTLGDFTASDVRLMLECLVRICDDAAAPTWTKGDEFEKLR